VLWNGKETVIYHYDATIEYPYTVGCFRGTAISAGGHGGPPGPPRPSFGLIPRRATTT
jgi:hypothetical protein